MEKQELSTQNLAVLRELRLQEKAIKAQIDQVNDNAVKEAIALLAKHNLTKGEFEVPDVGTFQLQRTDVFHLEDYNKYKGPEAVNWRAKAKEKLECQNAAKACTASMAGYVDAFVKMHPEKEPDEIKLVLKVIS